MNGGIGYFKRKYNLMNIYCLKKCPTRQLKREEVKCLYSYKNYARSEYFEHLEKVEEESTTQAER